MATMTPAPSPQHRDPATIHAELDAALQEYREGAHTLAAPTLAELSTSIKLLQQELSDACAMGSKTCPQCGNLPHGMERRPGLFEVGCLACLPELVKIGTVTMRKSSAARGKTAAAAVDNWNAQRWILEPVQER